jgi:hypothetical protein
MYSAHGVGYAQVVGSMWLPHEKLYAASDDRVIVTGYVVSEDNGIVYVLESGDRALLVYEASAIGKREVCAVRYTYPFSRSSYGVQTLLQRIGRRNPVPDC